MNKSNTRKKNVFGIMILVIILIFIVLIFTFNKKDNRNEKLAELIKINESRTFDVDGKEAKYTLLKNKDGTVYGIQFKNPDLMTEITTIRTSARENIKDAITEEGIYLFEEDAIYKLKIETINEISIVTDTFRVVTQKATK